MADVKISALTALGAAPAAADQLPIVDSSAGATKKVTIAELFTNPNVTGTVTADGLTVDGNVDTSAITINIPYGSAAEKYSALRWNNSSFAGGDSEIRNVVNGALSVGSSLEFHTEQTGTGTLTERLKLHDNGDISFYEDTGTTAKFFWDASAESLGIGTTSPQALLHVDAGAAATQAILGGSRPLYVKSNTTPSNHVSLGYGNNEHIIIDSSGKVGIGTTSPSYKLDVAGTVRIGSGGSIQPILYRDGTTGCLVADTTGAAGASLIVKNNGSESARIDGSGNLLVGKTSTSFSTEGAYLGQNGKLVSTRTSGSLLALNRLTTDGAIAEFYKDGTTVGSIGSRVGEVVYIQSGQSYTGLDFSSSILPRKANALNDAGVDLGTGTYRFKDLYLSGGVYLGGTGAANLLDDYEEGTWTPTLYGSTSGTTPLTVTHASYTKIGDTVHVICYLTNINGTTSTSAGSIRLGGLPFQVKNQGYAPTLITHQTIFSIDPTGYANSNTTYIVLLDGFGTGSVLDADINSITNGLLMLNLTYKV